MSGFSGFVQVQRQLGDVEAILLGDTAILQEEAENILRRLEEKTKQWSSDKYSFSLSIAAGFARAKDYSGLTAEELTKKADQAMYASKAAYYQSHRQNQ